MSKMSQIHAELCEQAYELGFESIEQAEANGYRIDYNGDGWKLKLDVAKAQEQAHEEWLKQKSQLLTRLAQLKIYLNNRVEHGHFWGKDDWEVVADAIEFIEKGEM